MKIYQNSILNNPNKKKTGIEHKDIGRNFNKYEDIKQIFDMIEDIIKYCEKNEENMRNFNEIKKTFLNDFEEETKEFS